MVRKMFLPALAAALGLLGVPRSLPAADPVVVQCCPADDCGHKVCRPTTGTKVIEKRVYDDTCEDFCLPKCSLLGGLFGRGGCCEDGCGGAKCGHPRTKKYLLVKIRRHEECVNKCEVVHESCPTACCPTAPCGTPAPVAVPPAPPVKGAMGYQPMPLQSTTPDMGPMRFPPMPATTGYPGYQGMGPVGYQPLPSGYYR